LRRVLLAVALGGLVVACAPTAPVARPEPKAAPKAPLVMTPGRPQHIAPRLALGPDRRVYAAWLSLVPGERRFEVLFSRSDDDGLTWLPRPISLQRDTSRNPGSLHLFAEPDGTLYVIYVLGLRTGKRDAVLLRSLDHGRTWQEPITIRSGSNLHASVFLQDTRGALYGVIPVGGGDFDWKLETYRGYAKGTEWFPLWVLEWAYKKTGTGIRDFHAMVDDQERLHVVWSETPTLQEPALIHYNRLVPGRGWLSSPVRVSAGGPSSRGAQNPRIALDRSGRLFAVWQEFWNPQLGSRFEGAFPPKIQVTRSLDDGEHWVEPTRLSPPGVAPAVSTGATIAAGAEGHVYVAWIEGDSNRPDRLRFARSADGGATWEAPDRPLYRADPESYLHNTLHLHADVSGRVCLLWQQLEGDGWKLLFTRSTDHGRTWLPKPYQLARTRQFQTGAHAVTVHVDGPRVFVAWDGGPGPDSDIFATHSLDFGNTWASRDVQISRQ